MRISFSTKDRVEMGFFVTRYVSCLLIFVLGLKAPGLVSYYQDDEQHLVDNVIYLLT